MGIRYAFGVALGLVTTFVLFMIMQSVIKSDRNPFTEGFDGRIVDIVRLDEDMEIEVKKRKPPKPPYARRTASAGASENIEDSEVEDSDDDFEDEDDEPGGR